MYCVVVYTKCRHMYCVVLYTGCRLTCCVSSVDACIAWCGMLCVMYVFDAHYLYVYMAKEKALGVCLVWKMIQSVYGIRTKLEAKD